MPVPSVFEFRERLRQWYLAKFPSQAGETWKFLMQSVEESGPGSHLTHARRLVHSVGTSFEQLPSPQLNAFLTRKRLLGAASIQVDIYHSISANMLPTPAK